MNGKILEKEFQSKMKIFLYDLEGATSRVLSFLNETNERHVASLVNEKRKVTVIGEEHEPEENVRILVIGFFLR